MTAAFSFAHNVVLEATSCAKCGVTFAVPDSWLVSLRKSGATFYCPAGHSLSYGDGEVGRLRKMLDEANRKATRLAGQVHTAWSEVDEAKRQGAHEAARANGYKGVLAKTKKRIAAGCCPCCNRTFTNLQRHMATKHPAFVARDQRETADISKKD